MYYDVIMDQVTELRRILSSELPNLKTLAKTIQLAQTGSRRSPSGNVQSSACCIM